MSGTQFYVGISVKISNLVKTVKGWPTCGSYNRQKCQRLPIFGQITGKNAHFHPFRGVWGSWAINTNMSGTYFYIKNSADIKFFWKMSKIRPHFWPEIWYDGQITDKNAHFHPFRGVWGFWAINTNMSGTWFCIRNTSEKNFFLNIFKDPPTFLTWDLG